MQLNLNFPKLRKLIPALLAIISFVVPMGLKRQQRDEVKRLHDMPMAEAMVAYSEIPGSVLGE